MNASKNTASSKRIQLSILVISLIWILSIAFSNNPPNGRTGAPGEGLCSDCHTQASPPQDGNIAVDFPASINANQTYTLSVTVNNPNALGNLAGFQMTILNSSNQIAGSMSNASVNSVISSFNGREYHEHNPAQAFPGSNAVSWTVDWTAPSGPDMETITYYAAGNIANGNGSSSGDLIVTSSVSGTLMGGANPPTVVITDVVHVLCNSESTGSALAVASEGTPPYSYAWSNGTNGTSLIDVSAGIYSVTVTDQANATSSAMVEILEPGPIVEINSQIEDVSCFGGNDGSIDITIGGGVLPYSFTWANGAITEDISNLVSGNYMLTVTDQNGCANEFLYIINEPLNIEISVDDFIDILCFGDQNGSASLSASGGTGSFIFEWSNGVTGASQNGLSPGSYTITATDENGCTATEVLFFSEPSELNIETIVVDDAFCFGDPTGGIQVNTSGGTGSHIIEWSNGATGNTILNLVAGIYTATVTDENLCTASINVEVGEPDALAVSVSEFGNISCFGGNDGFITLTVIGGTPDYIISWSNGEIGPSIQNLGPGTYSATVEDMNACMEEIQVVVTEPSSIEITGTVTDESSAGAADGAVTVSVVGGTPPYSFLWNNGSIDSTLIDLAPGTYTVTVTDQNNCSTQSSFTVGSAGCNLSLEITSTNVSCFEANDGTATVSVTGAAEPFQVSWSNGDTTETIIGLAELIYSVTVTDANGCQSESSIQILQPPIITFSCSLAVATGTNNADGFAECVAMGGVPPYTYLWSNGITTTANPGLLPGEYSLTVTDATGCQMSEIVTIDTSMCLIEYSILSTPASCFGEQNGEASFNLLSGAIPPIVYSWSSGSENAIASGLGAGTHYVTVTDAGGCEIIDSVTITQPDQISITVDSVIAASGGSDGSIFITVTGGTQPYEYSWVFDNQQISTEEDPGNLAPGLYQINILDANLCFGGQSDILVDGPTSTGGVKEDLEVLAYPNPTKDFLDIEILSSNSSNISITLVDVQGAEIVINSDPTFEQGKFRIETNHLHAGIYFLVIQTNHSRMIHKIVK